MIYRSIPGKTNHMYVPQSKTWTQNSAVELRGIYPSRQMGRLFDLIFSVHFVSENIASQINS
jgi:hypothetical protein